MKKLTRFNSEIKKVILISVCVYFAFLLIKYPSLSADGVRKGLHLSAGTMVPSLFPFLVLSGFLTESGVIDLLGRKSDKLFRKIFNSSGTAGSAVFISLFSGFPVGAKTACSLYEKNKITKTEAHRIALSSVNAGPAFVIGAVGSMMLSSVQAGVIIFVSLSVSSILIFFLTRFIFEENDVLPSIKNSTPSVSEALVNAVYSSSKAIILICAWVLVFSCIANILSAKITNENYLSYIKAILEVSIGCEEMAEKKSPVILSAVLAWSGLSVHCQIFPYIQKIGLKAKHLFCSRLTHAMLASLICTFLLKIFPCEISVFSNMSQISLKVFSVSAPAAAGLILMCAIFVLDLDRLKKV